MNFKETTLTIIVPIFNEELVIEKFLSQLNPVVKDLRKNQSVRVLFVNNGSTDSSLELLLQKASELEDFGILTLARNFGYETALVAGLTHADGHFFALCDGDGEDPVSLLIEFQNSIMAGNQIAIGIRRKRIESVVTKSFRTLSYSILSRLGDDPFRKNAGNFSMFSKVARDAILIENNSYPFLRSTLSRTGYRIEEFPHNRNPRIDGKSKYRKISLLKFAIAGFMTTTTWPLRFVSYLGGLNFIGIAGYMFALATGHGQAQINYILLTLGWELLGSVGVISLYLARIYKNSLGRPLFYVDWNESHALGAFEFAGRD